MGYSPCGRKESDTTERLHFHFMLVLTVGMEMLSNLTSTYSFGKYDLFRQIGAIQTYQAVAW